jgi:sec-independent protein translocase protein TatA
MLHLPFAIMGLGSTELIVILGICVLLFGAAKIPQLARSVGQSINEFKRGMGEGKKEDPPAAPPADDSAGKEKKD